jgi:hypothetical protein
MTSAAELLRQGRRDEVWTKYCGFLDLKVEEFIDIQERLLLGQLHLLGKSGLGQKLLGERVPSSVEEFRQAVPLTTYRDYLEFLVKGNEDFLPARPQVWARTSGRSGEYECKWAPYTSRMVKKAGEFAIAAFLLGSCSGRGDVRLAPNDTCLYTLAPPPYFTGAVVAQGLQEELQPTFIPSLEAGNQMDFEERIRKGFAQALSTGIDLFYGLSSVLVKIAEQFQAGGNDFEFSTRMLNPRLLYRVIRGLVESKTQSRGLLPNDLWKVKSIVAGGMDTAFYSDAIKEYWGVAPLEGYGGTELGGIGLQGWNRKGMTFLPDCNFLEFIPENDFFQSWENPDYQPSTLTVDELQPGVYELVITNFHGGVFVRYRTGDLVEIVSMEDPEIGVALPQMVFHARADGVIDVGGFTRLTEKAMWQAIEESEIPYVEWTMRKEYLEGRPTLHLYVELVDGHRPAEVQTRVSNKLRDQDPGYGDLETMLGLEPLVVTKLSAGAFTRYQQTMREAGADLAHIKPPRVNPTNEVINRLLKQ